jgi:hypothetical protein
MTRATLTRGRSVAEQLGLKAKHSKYRNVKTVVDGITFDSRAEARRWRTLRMLERVGEIINLRRQVKFSLDVNGVHICDYVCDFIYGHCRQSRPITVIEDVKSIATMTPAYRLKKKLMKAIYGIEIVEVGVRKKKRRRK